MKELRRKADIGADQKAKKIQNRDVNQVIISGGQNRVKK